MNILTVGLVSSVRIDVVVKMFLLKLLLLFVCSFVNLSISQEQATEQFQNYRLPKNVVPSRYSLSILIDLAELSFSGNVTISVHVSAPTILISLNYKEIAVDWDNVKLCTSNANRSFTFESHELRPVDEIADLRLSEQLPIGDYLIVLSFSATMRSDLHGLYISSYRYIDGTKRYGLPSRRNNKSLEFHMLLATWPLLKCNRCMLAWYSHASTNQP